MGRLKPEQQIQNACKSRLEVWEMKKVVIHFDDISNAGRKFNPFTGTWVMNTKSGRPDLIAYINKKGICWVYLIEIKAPDGGVWSSKQQDYAAKFNTVSNVVYEVVKNPSQIDCTIEFITGHEQEILDNIKL